MSTRPQFNPYPVIPSINESPANSTDMTLTLISAPTIILKLSMISYEVSWTGVAPVGTLAVQVSNSFSLNPDGTVNNPGIWTVLPLQLNGTTVQAVPITGNSGNGFIDIDELGAYALRAVFTPVSGTGNLQIIINAKVA